MAAIPLRSITARAASTISPRRASGSIAAPSCRPVKPIDHMSNKGLGWRCDHHDTVPPSPQRAEQDRALRPLVGPPLRPALQRRAEARVLRGPQQRGGLRHLAALQVLDPRPRRRGLARRRVRPRHPHLPTGPRPVHDLVRRPGVRHGGRRGLPALRQRVLHDRGASQPRLPLRPDRQAPGRDRGRVRPVRHPRHPGPPVARTPVRPDR